MFNWFLCTEAQLESGIGLDKLGYDTCMCEATEVGLIREERL